MPDLDQRTTTTSTTSSGGGASTAGVTDEAQQLVGNQAIIDVIKAQNHPTGERELNPTKDGIVFLGMNKDAHAEARRLNGQNRGRGGAGGAVAAVPQKEQDHYKRGGKDYDLTTAEGAASFVATLGLPDQLAVNVADFLLNGPGDARDELAQFVRILSEAEMGERSIDRMVLSGHSVGSMIWGDDNGMINFSVLDELFELFPKAAEQVEHLMLSACYTGGESKMGQYTDMMPGLESVWAYHGSSPGTWSGAMPHMDRWEAATESGKDASGVDPSLAQGTRKDHNVSTWNTTDGYQGDKPMSIWELTRELDSQDSVYQAHFSGDEEVANSQSGPLRTYYGLVQRALSHPELPSSRRAELDVRRDVTIRLLYFKLISGKFQNHYKGQLEAGYAEAGIPMPDFSTLTRAQALAAVEALEATGAAATALDLLQRGIRDLSTDVIPTAWV
jgi:hypothetical protein